MYIEFWINRRMIGHFTAMMHEKNVAIGCALIKFRARHPDGRTYFEAYFVCNYSYTNMLGESIYTPVRKGGRAGSGCPDTDNVYTGLCNRSGSETIESKPDGYKPVKYTKENQTSMSPRGTRQQQPYTKTTVDSADTKIGRTPQMAIVRHSGNTREWPSTQDTAKYTESGWNQASNPSIIPLHDITTILRNAGTGGAQVRMISMFPQDLRRQHQSPQDKTNTGTGWPEARTNPLSLNGSKQVTQDITYVTPDGRVFRNKEDLEKNNIRSYTTHMRTLTRTISTSPRKLKKNVFIGYKYKNYIL